MQRTLAVTLLCGMLTLGMWGIATAHTLFMNVDDTGEGTIIIEGIYSTGASAAFTPVRFQDAEGNVLWEGKTDDLGQIEAPKPDVPFTIVLDGGPGHVVENAIP